MNRKVEVSSASEAIISPVAVLTLILFAVTTLASAEKAKEVEEQRDLSTITTGSGERYQTVVDRKTEGALSAQGLHQVSLG
ncbi:hypothetical protein ACFL2P_00975 [Candidatus Moduliflexota bacterium]